MRPLGKRLLVKKETPKETTESGIIIPIKDDGEPKKAIVLNVGDISGISEGDTILFNGITGSPVKYNEEDCLIIREDDVYAVI
jgi:chaperonin GroES